MGCLAFIPLLVSLVAGVLGFGARCFKLEGISEICLSPAEQLAAKVVMLLAAAAVSSIARLSQCTVANVMGRCASPRTAPATVAGTSWTFRSAKICLPRRANSSSTGK